MTAPNFVLISELQTLTRRDFPLAAPALLEPHNANPLLDGEFLELDSSYKAARGAPGGTNNEGINAMVFPVHTERGRTDTQAIGKANLLLLGQYEAETTIMDATSVAVGSPLTVADVTIGGLTKRGLRVQGAVAGRVVVGYVSKIVSGKIRFIHFANQKVI